MVMVCDPKSQKLSKKNIISIRLWTKLFFIITIVKQTMKNSLVLNKHEITVNINLEGLLIRINLFTFLQILLYYNAYF